MVSYKNPQEFTEKRQKYQEYIGALEEERKKIQVFERELPLCLELVTQAIERYRQQVSGTIEDCFNGQQVSSDYPVLEEYIPMNRTSSANEEANGDTQKQQKKQLFHKSKIVCSKDWLASAQLSIQTPDPPIEVDFLSKKLLDMEGDRNGCGGFHPFQKKNTSDAALTIGVERCAAVAAISSSIDTDFDGGGGGSDGGGISRVEDKGRVNKKERRCWSPELHRRFLHALQQLGGAHAATPKQIKESMKVDGLTNDEIKSHLQKYRLHTRRMNPPPHNDEQTPQLVLVGRIWVPPLEYTAKTASSPPTATANNANAVYTPIASLPPSSITTSLYKTKPCKQRPPSVEKN